MTDYKQLCAELLAALEEEASNWNLDPECHPLVVRARAALAKPEAEEPTCRQLMMLADDMEMTSVGDAAEYARAVLARWGNHPGSPDSSTPQPSAGEVAGIAEWLKKRGRLADLGTKDWYFRAADLLERLSPPQPVPVSKRLPEPEDCDAGGRCWWYGNGEDMVGWTFQDLEGLSYYRSTHWLSAHALPQPS